MPASLGSDPVVVADALLEHLLGSAPNPHPGHVEALLCDCEAQLPLLLQELRERESLHLLVERYTLPLLQVARRGETLPAVFRHIVDDGLYEVMRQHLPRLGSGHDELLSDLAEARPSFDEETLNEEALSTLEDSSEEDYAFDALIVPGFTPLSASRPLGVRDLPAAQKRLDLALALFRHGTAPVILVSGGCVYPAGTPINEALSMREYLLSEGCDESAILVEPYARHTTTNLRNAGRILRRVGRSRGLIVTGFDNPVFSQAFYLSNPTLSTFRERCRRELGYFPGELRAHAENQIAFFPSPDVERRTPHDPWDV